MAPCPAGLWGCPGTSGAWGRAEMLLCWLGGSPSLPPWQGELRIRGSPEAAGSAPRWSRRGGWRGNNLGHVGHQWVLPNPAEGAEGLPGLGPLRVVLWLPNSLCVSLEGAGGELAAGRGELLPPLSLTSFLPVGGSGIALLPPPVLLSREEPTRSPGWGHCWQRPRAAAAVGCGTGPDFGSTAARPGFPALLGFSCSCFPIPSCCSCSHSLPWARIHPGEEVAPRVGGTQGGWHRGGWHHSQAPISPPSLFCSSGPGCPPGAGCPWQGCRWDPREPPRTEQRPR